MIPPSAGKKKITAIFSRLKKKFVAKGVALVIEADGTPGIRINLTKKNIDHPPVPFPVFPLSNPMQGEVHKE